VRAGVGAAGGAARPGALRGAGRCARLGVMSDGLPVTGVSELVLEVVDLEAAEDFYATVLGLPVVERWPEREAIWVMAGDRTRIGLWRPQVGLAQGRGGIHVHFAMHVAQVDFAGAVQGLRDRGAEVETIEFPGYGGSQAAYVHDPDGNVVEIWTWDVAHHLDPADPDAAA
jgi:catechol 2,3-dioxygenase-like lactoylglutathione lyase family enzyme